jgi:hypothetical protein
MIGFVFGNPYKSKQGGNTMGHLARRPDKRKRHPANQKVLRSFAWWQRWNKINFKYYAPY